MNGKKILGIVAVFLGCLAIARAQAPNAMVPAVPAPPYIKVPEMSAWTVLFQGNGDIKQVSVIRTKSHRQVVILHVDGKREELWSKGGDHIANTGAGVTLVQYFISPQNLLEEYQAGDFPDFAWVNKENYLKTVEIEGRGCLAFQGAPKKRAVLVDMREMEMAPPKQASSPADPQLLTALIDKETRLPLQLTNGREVRKVVFSAPPTEMLRFPPQVAHLFQQKEKLGKISNIRPPRGG